MTASPDVLPEIDQLTDTLSPTDQRVVNDAEIVDFILRDTSSPKAAQNALGLVGDEVAQSLGVPIDDMRLMSGRLAGVQSEIEHDPHPRTITVGKTMAEALLESMRRAGDIYADTDHVGGFYASVGKYMMRDMYNPSVSTGMHVQAGRPVIVL